jgi:stage V sporulation protein G
MKISEVRVKLIENPRERLQAFCSITLDGDFVIRDLKVIEGTNGAFVAMPSRKLADKCPRCRAKNHLRARYCNECGAKLGENRALKDGQGRAKLHADVAHPINVECRESIQRAVIQAYEEEKEASKSPDYQPQEIDDFDDGLDNFNEQDEKAASEPQAEQPQEEEQAEHEEPQPPERSKRKDDRRDFASDYNSLIADLKKDAAERRGGQKVPSRRPPREDRGEHQPVEAMPAASLTEQKPLPPPKPVVPERQPAAVVPDSQPAPVTPEPQPASDEEEEDPFSAGLL